MLYTFLGIAFVFLSKTESYSACVNRLIIQYVIWKMFIVPGGH